MSFLNLSASLPPTSGEAAIQYLSIFAVSEKGEGDNKKSYFTRVGVAFPHRTGAGFNLILDLLPAAGQKLVAMPPKN